jgi:imidazolonepropionase-like amidohydrolase
MDATLAIVGGTVIDGNGDVPISNGTVLIEGPRIVAVGDSSIKVPPEAIRIPVAGKYVIPGLMDANVHLFFAITPDGLIRYQGRYEDVVAEAAQLSLKNGLTTVFDTWGPMRALRAVQRRIEQGELVGSRIFLAGNIIGLGGPTSPDFLPQARTVLARSEADAIDAEWEQGVGSELLWLTPNQARARVRDYIGSRKPDFLKYAASGHAGSHMQYICFSAAIQKAIVEEGHAAGLTVQAHTTSPESLRMEIEAGADLLQHPDITCKAPIPDETLRQIAQRRLPCAALLATCRFLAWIRAHAPPLLKELHCMRDDNDRRLIEAGATLLLTTDSGVIASNAADHPLNGEFVRAEDLPSELGEGHFRWLQAARELGLKPMDALMAATRNIARAYRVDRDLGTLENGKLADLLILDQDPLADPANYRSIHSIIKDGREIARSSLPTSRVLTARVTP